MDYSLKKCATTTRKIFLFFLGGPTQSVQAFFGWARPVASSLQAVKQFIFIFILYLGLDGIYMAGERRSNMSEASEELKRIAAALEEILRLVKQDQEKFQKINEKN